MVRSYQSRPWEREYTTPQTPERKYASPTPSGQTPWGRAFPQPPVGGTPTPPGGYPIPSEIGRFVNPAPPSPSYELGRFVNPAPPWQQGGQGGQRLTPPWQPGMQRSQPWGNPDWWTQLQELPWYQQLSQQRQQMLQRRQGYATGGGQQLSYGGQPWQGGPLAPTGTPPPGMGWQ